MNNKWTRGKVYFELPELPPQLLLSHGLKPIAVVLDDQIGQEVVLLVTEPDSKVAEFKGRDIIRFMMKIGLVNTSFGPVCFVLFYFPDPVTGAQVTYENTINPKDTHQVAIYEQLAQQQYWHVLIAGDSGNVANFFEFPNEYGLGQSLEQVREICAPMTVSDFWAAKAEYESKYSVDQLLEM